MSYQHLSRLMSFHEKSTPLHIKPLQVEAGESDFAIFCCKLLLILSYGVKSSCSLRRMLKESELAKWKLGSWTASYQFRKHLRIFALH